MTFHVVGLGPRSSLSCSSCAEMPQSLRKKCLGPYEAPLPVSLPGDRGGVGLMGFIAYKIRNAEFFKKETFEGFESWDCSWSPPTSFTCTAPGTSVRLRFGQAALDGGTERRCAPWRRHSGREQEGREEGRDFLAEGTAGAKVQCVQPTVVGTADAGEAAGVGRGGGKQPGSP